MNISQAIQIKPCKHLLSTDLQNGLLNSKTEKIPDDCTCRVLLDCSPCDPDLRKSAQAGIAIQACSCLSACLSTLQVMNADNPVRLVFVLPAPDATDFKVEALTKPSMETKAALEAVLKRLELFALYVPVQTISSRSADLFVYLCFLNTIPGSLPQDWALFALLIGMVTFWLADLPISAFF